MKTENPSIHYLSHLQNHVQNQKNLFSEKKINYIKSIAKISIIVNKSVRINLLQEQTIKK